MMPYKRTERKETMAFKENVEAFAVKQALSGAP